MDSQVIQAVGVAVGVPAYDANSVSVGPTGRHVPAAPRVCYAQPDSPCMETSHG